MLGESGRFWGKVADVWVKAADVSSAAFGDKSSRCSKGESGRCTNFDDNIEHDSLKRLKAADVGFFVLSHS